MYPIKCSRHFVSKVWGGRNLSNLLSIELPGNSGIGETWELSVREDISSFAENGRHKGKSLESIIKGSPETIMGKKIVKQHGSNFPLIIKFLDINDKLSIQVHPDNDYAKYQNELYGKHESWYVLGASEDAEIIYGLKDGVDRSTLEAAIYKNRLENLFNIVKVKAGDFLDIKPGVVHGTLNGSVQVCEIQQNSDLTYRLFDFDRLYKGRKRKLHIKQALNVIDYDIKNRISSENTRIKSNINGNNVSVLIQNDYYSILHCSIKNELKFPVHSNFTVYSIISGSGEVCSNNSSLKISQGDTIFVPANLSLKAIGNMKLIRTMA